MLKSMIILESQNSDLQKQEKRSYWAPVHLGAGQEAIAVGSLFNHLVVFGA